MYFSVFYLFSISIFFLVTFNSVQQIIKGNLNRMGWKFPLFIFVIYGRNLHKIFAILSFLSNSIEMKFEWIKKINKPKGLSYTRRVSSWTWSIEFVIFCKFKMLLSRGWTCVVILWPSFVLDTMWMMDGQTNGRSDRKGWQYCFLLKQDLLVLFFSRGIDFN